VKRSVSRLPYASSGISRNKEEEEENLLVMDKLNTAGSPAN
jgi:hypothetical protein